MLQTGVLRDTGADAADDSLDIKALLRILNKYKWLLLAFALLGLMVSVGQDADQHAAVPGHRHGADRAPARRIVAFKGDVSSSDEYEDYMALPTQVELLRSRALAERVVDELNLDPSRSQAPAPGVLGEAPSHRIGARAGAPTRPPAGPRVMGPGGLSCPT